ncbi:MAG: metallophosphoesterase, partial [Bacteroidota bacterium]
MRYLLLISLSLLGFCPWALGQQTPAKIIIDADATVNPWNHLEVNNQPSTFQFAIVTDRTGGLRPGIFPDAVNKLNLLQPEFVMSVGDLISGYTEDEARIDQEWNEFTGFIENLQMPFFYLPGNHDYINDVMARKWKERFGKDWYQFVYKDVLFLCLNSEELKRGAGRGYIDLPQFEYAAKVLEDHPDVKWTMVFLHQPLWDQEDPGMWPELEALMAERKHTVFAGHRHRYVKYERNENNYFVLATTGGGSSLRGPAFGEFDHVVWITMTDDGPIMANLMLDGIWDDNVRTEDMLERSRPWMEHALMKIEPLLDLGANFSQGETKLTFSNPADIPMKVDLNVISSASLWAKLDQTSLEIPPNSVEQISFTIQGDKRIPLDKRAPIELKPTFTFESEGEPTLSWSESFAIQPQRTFAIVRPEETIDVDGDLSD